MSQARYQVSARPAMGSQVGWVLMVLLLLGIAGCGDRSRGAGEPKEQPGAAARVTVRVEPAQRRRLVVKVYGLGQTEALPDHRAAITAAVQEEVAPSWRNRALALRRDNPLSSFARRPPAMPWSRKRRSGMP